MGTVFPLPWLQTSVVLVIKLFYLSSLPSRVMEWWTAGSEKQEKRSLLSRQEEEACCRFWYPFIFPFAHRSPLNTSHVKTVAFSLALAVSTALYCLYAARPGYSWRLDGHKKGNILKADKDHRREGFLISSFLPPSQAMASLAPHRVKVDGKSLPSSSATVNTWQSADIDPSLTLEGFTQCFVLFFPFCFAGKSLQWNRTDITMWRAPRKVGFSTTTSGTAGDRPSASTEKTSFQPGMMGRCRVGEQKITKTTKFGDFWID